MLEVLCLLDHIGFPVFGIETETIFKSMLEGEGMRARLADEKGMRPVLPAKFVAYLDEISGETGGPLR